MTTVNEGGHAQADLLPRKRGEIGYVEDVQRAAAPEGDNAHGPSASSISLPAQHPADRPYAGDSIPPTLRSTSSSGPSPATNGAAARAPSPVVSHSSQQSAGKRSFISFLGPIGDSTVAGLHFWTLATFFLQVGVLAATIVVWAFIITHIKAPASFGSVDADPTQSDDSGSQPLSPATETLSSTIFVHAAFIIASIGELVFLERTVFRLRAERYAFVHPGEMLPSSRRRAPGRVGVGLVPWNRVDLPTYAAALRESGVRTGDVEDSAIAVPPPPAYGNIRSSTLLLAGPRRKRESAASTASSQRASRPMSQVLGNGLRPLSLRPAGVQYQDRPVSYRSEDSSWEEVLDADRARHLEAILSGAEIAAPERSVTRTPRS